MDVDGYVNTVIQPQLIVVGTVTEYDRLFVAVEGHELCSISNNCCLDGIVALLASFYIFNIDYQCAKGFFSFLETVMLGKSRYGGALPIVVNSFINAL